MIPPLRFGDPPAALAIQAAFYPPAIRDSDVAFASRIAVAPDWCWAVETDGRLDAYLLSHPWKSMDPPPPDTVLKGAGGDVWYIHDLSVAPSARGRDLGTRLLATCLDAHPDVQRSELVAVPGAAPFWTRRGWTESPSVVLRAKVAVYGEGSSYLEREWR